MKVCILTQPLHHNYGGLLQAFALQKFLNENGCDAITIDIQYRRPKLFGLKGILINIFNKYVMRKKITHIFPLSASKKKNICRNTDMFIRDYIKKSQSYYGISKLSELSTHKYDAFVVGSDQVWRPAYSPGLDAFFFNFLKEKEKRISYAASFGINNANEFSPEQKIKYSNLLKKFTAISVREKAGIHICNKDFNVDAKLVLDPTLILDINYYNALIEKSALQPLKNSMMVYVLDSCENKNRFINKILNNKALDNFSINLDDKGIYPKVEEWLNGFKTADFIITDSFHGMVFSILFNKQFIVLGNPERGMERFESLLQLLGLENRLIYIINNNSEYITNELIDYSKVNDKLKREVKSSRDFLLSSIFS